MIRIAEPLPPDNGPYDYRGRFELHCECWYDPTMGKWLTDDPVGFADGDCNLYCYVGNSPTNGTDPRGTDTPLWQRGVSPRSRGRRYPYGDHGEGIPCRMSPRLGPHGHLDSVLAKIGATPLNSPHGSSRSVETYNAAWIS